MIPLGVLAQRQAATGGGVVITSDSFNRADAAIDGVATDAALGGSPITWYNNASYEVNANQLRSTSDRARWASVYVGNGDVTVSAKVTTLGEVRICARARTTDMRSERYAAELSADGSVALTIEFSGLTTLGTAAAGTVTAGDTLALRCVGTSHEVLVNGSTVIAVTDSTNPGDESSDYVGLQSNNSAWRLDDFKVEEA